MYRPLSRTRLIESPYVGRHGLRVRLRPLLALALDSAPLFLLFLALHWWVLSVGRLPEAGYFRPFVALELLRGLGLLQLALLLSVVALLTWRGALARRWTELDGGAQWRPWLLLIVVILAWTHATYDYNWYYGQGHYLDRMLVLGLAVAVVWRPAFLFPFALLVAALAGQFDHPIGGYSVAEQFLLVRVLLLFCAALLLQAVWGRPVRTAFGLLLLTLIASSYWWPGLGKLRLLWFTHGHIHLLLPAAYSSGWLAFLRPDVIGWVARFLDKLDPLMMAFTLVAECGALLFLVRRPVARLLLASWAAMHLGIVALSGIFFWKWLLVDLGLLWLLSRSSHAPLLPVFGRDPFLLSVLLIGASHFWYDPVNLSWYDTPVNYAYRVEAVGASGRAYPLPPRFFAPYEYQFSLGAFGYLVDEPRLGIVYGAVWDRAVADKLLTVRSADDLSQLETQQGNVRLDTHRAARLDDLVRRRIGPLNAGAPKKGRFTHLQAPSQLLSFPYNPQVDGGEPIVTVRIHQVTALFDGDSYREIRDRVVREIAIGSHPTLVPEANR